MNTRSSEIYRVVEEDIIRHVGSIVYSIYGSVGYELDYIEGQIHLVVWDRSYKCDEKEEVINTMLNFDFTKKSRIESIHDVVAMIEKYLIENQ